MTCRILKDSEEEIAWVIRHLQAGGLAALPAETVYGLAADATNVEASRKIFEVKGRPLIDPLIVHVATMDKAESLAYFDERSRHCARQFWPGPLTMILKRKAIVDDLITAGLDTVAIRMPAHPIFRCILERGDLALAAPSANPFGYISPSRADHVLQHLGDRIEVLVDGGPCDHGVESTIIDMSEETPRILRPGPLSASQLSRSLGVDVALPTPHGSALNNEALKASGSMDRHYSPQTPARLCLNFAIAQTTDAKVYCRRPLDSALTSSPDVYWLSESGSAIEMMRNLYALVHHLDDKGYGRILFQTPENHPDYGAVSDRLFKACGSSKILG